MSLKGVTISPEKIHQVGPCTYEIPIGFIPNMRVPGYFYSTPEMSTLAFDELNKWMANRQCGLPSIIQIATVATLPGISKASFGMPDMHSGYGFSIGGVAAFDLSDPSAIISPGGVGYDINCGVRCLTTGLKIEQVEEQKSVLIDLIAKNVPYGVGGTRKKFITRTDLENVLKNGVEWAVDAGFAEIEDIECCEERGKLIDANPDCISERAKIRGVDQLGTIGSGNHYIEIQAIDEIFDTPTAEKLGLKKGEACIMIHTGSRGLGQQVASEYMEELGSLPENRDLIDRQLSCVKFASPEGQKYWGAMCAAANYAWVNRQIVTFFVREVFKQVFGNEIKLPLIYDVCHNIAKVEEFGGKRFIVHRKGATRAFGPYRDEIPNRYKEIGQPVLIGGSFGTASYILVGTPQSMDVAFGSTCHGSGRVLSRTGANKVLTEQNVRNELKEKGIVLKAASKHIVIEEAPETYKDVDGVIEACQTVGLSKKVARTIPMAVIKG